MLLHTETWALEIGYFDLFWTQSRNNTRKYSQKIRVICFPASLSNRPLTHSIRKGCTAELSVQVRDNKAFCEQECTSILTSQEYMFWSKLT